MEKIIKNSLIALSIVPLVVTSTILPAISGKILFYRGIAFLVLFLTGVVIFYNYSNISEKIKKLPQSKIFISVSVFFTTFIISTIFALNPYTAFFGRANRDDGLLTLIAIYFLYVSFVLFFNKKDWNKFFGITAGLSFIMFFIQTIQIAQGVDRPFATLGNPIFLACFFLFCFFSGLWFLTQDEFKKNIGLHWLSYSALIISPLGILLAKSRGTMLAVFVAILLTILLFIFYPNSIKIKPYPIRKIGIIGLMVIMSFVLFFWTTKSMMFWQKIPGFDRIATTSEKNTTSRELLVTESIVNFSKNTTKEKMVGIGWDNYQYFWMKNYNPDMYLYDRNFIDRSHNRVVDILIMNGVVGLVAFGVMWILVLKRVFNIIKNQFFLGISLFFLLISYFVHDLFTPDFPVLLMSFFIILALLTQYEQE